MSERLGILVSADGTVVVLRGGKVMAKLAPEMVEAAPQMLKALKATDEYLDDDRDTDLHYDIVVAQIRAAIAAAEGTDT